MQLAGESRKRSVIGGDPRDEVRRVGFHRHDDVAPKHDFRIDVREQDVWPNRKRHNVTNRHFAEVVVKFVGR